MKTIARTYNAPGDCRELVQVCGNYFITVNGRVQDARTHVSLSAAQRFYDDAGYQIGERPR